jgi:YD repeat-containing protein
VAAWSLLAAVPVSGVQQQAPIQVWCLTSVPGLYDSPQNVCNAAQAFFSWPWPLTYLPDPAAPPYAPRGTCQYSSNSGTYQIWGAELALGCPSGYQPVDFAHNSQRCTIVAAGYHGDYTSPDGQIICQNTGVDLFKNKGPCPCPENGPGNNVGSPINSGTQNKHLTESDLAAVNGAAPLSFVRVYNSAPVPEVGSASILPVPLLVGRHWSGTYDTRVLLSTVGGIQTAWVTRPDGRVLHFNLSGGQWVPDPDISDRLVRTVDGNSNPNGWLYYVAATEATETYNVLGRLIATTSRSGATQTLVYDAQWRLSVVQDPFGRQLTVVIGANGLLQSLTDAAGHVTGYQYDAYGNLIEVDRPDGTLRRYHYENPTWKSALTGVTDENGTRHSTYSYDSAGNATITQLAGGVNKWTVSAGQVTDPLGNVNTRTFATVQGVVRLASASVPCATCGKGGHDKTLTYDANGNVSSRTDFNNRKACYAYDLTRNLETARAEGIVSADGTCSAVLATLPARADVRKVSTQWHGIWRLPTKIAEPSRMTTLAYNGDGGVYCAPPGALVAGNPIGVLCRKTVQETTDATGQQGLSATLTGTPRVWQYTYDQFGQGLTATDPNGRTTTTVYYAANDPDLGKRGNVQTITNPLGHVTTFGAYDGNGRPTAITDPNGVVTTLTYHPRGWLTARTVAGETTVYDYDGVGQLTKVTQPDGSYVQYTYDGAHRLTQLQDGLGNKIVYTLDAMGNRIKEEARDPSNNLARTQQRVYDSLNRLHQTVGAQ